MARKDSIVAPAISRETDRQRRGRETEERAHALLAAQGLRLVARNVRYRVGEIDLVMRDGAVLVFVEVRWRASDAFGGAAASVTAAKRRRLLRAAQLFLGGAAAGAGCDASLPACRFDVVAVGPGRIDWIRGAFAADGA